MPRGPKRPGREGRPWRRLKERVRREESICHLCDDPIDQALKWPDPLSFSVDHLVPVSIAPHLARVRSNVRAAHLGCNSSRGTGSKPRREPTAAPTTSIDW